jgi:hypothetical protein
MSLTKNNTRMLEGSLPNSQLENDSITINGSAVALGGSTTVGGGKIGQVVFATTSTEVNNGTTTYDDVGLSVSITPTAASSKIFVIVSASVGLATGTVNNQKGLVRLVRGSTEIAEYIGARFDGTAGVQAAFSSSYTALDSPSTASTVTYKVQQKLDTSGNNRQIFFSYQNALSTITLMEVLA